MQTHIHVVVAGALVIGAAAGAQPILTSALAPVGPAHGWANCRCGTPHPATDGLFEPNTWPGGVVFYKFHPKITATQRQQTLGAWGTLSAAANLQFVERTNQQNYIEVTYSKIFDVAFSTSIGMSGQKQYIAFWPAGHFDNPSLIMHETMHALGMWQEQQRPDREQFVEVIEEAVDPAYISNYNIVNATIDGPYDFASLMHYQQYAFSPTADRTMRVRPAYRRAWQWSIGQYALPEAVLSNGDIWALTRFYGGNPPPRAFVLQSPASGQAVGQGWAPAFSWQAAEAATGYRLQVDDTPLFTSPEIDVLTAQTSYAQATPLTNDRLYWWRVTASNAVGTAEAFPIKAIAFYTAAAYPATLYVDDSAPPGGDGTTWSTALQDLSTATETAYASGGGVGEVRVGQGIYTPGFGSSDRTMSFWLSDGCALKGGYEGYGASNPDARDIDLFETVLSGDLAGDDQQGFVNNGENVHNVVFSMSNTASTLLEGFTIVGGRAEAAVTPGLGGGIMVDAGTPTIRRCRFTGNQADDVGGAVSLSFSATDPLFEGCVFDGNRMSVGPRSFFLAGGGAIQGHNSLGRFKECVFTGNSALSGGVAFLWASRPEFVNCLMTGNAATAPVSGWVGGGALLSFGGSEPSLINCTVVGNTSPVPGGAVSDDAGSTTTIANSILWGNTPDQAVGGPLVSHSNVQGGAPGAGNINQAPVFLNSGDHSYALAAGSPGIDAASNLVVPGGVATDLADNPRFVDFPGAANTGVSGGAGGSAIVDMGAYERQGSEGVSCYADCNADGVLTVADFGCFQTKFVAADPYADCNADGQFTIADFGCFQTEFVAGCP